MKVYAEVLPDWLGRAMYRINENIRKYAPAWVEFTTDKNNADLQILDVIGTGSLEFLYVDKYIVIQHCFRTTETTAKSTWLPVWKNAKLVVGFLDIPNLIGNSSYNFYRLPWGADPEVFKRNRTPKKYNVLTTGHVSESETVDELYKSLEKTSGSIVHVGHDFRMGNRFHHKEDITDDELVNLYNQSYYVSGLRKVEGFELPVVEGLLCGARGICYNSEHYSYWFGDLVEYIEEDNSEGSYSTKAESQLSELFSKPYRPVTDAEIELVKNKFSWQTIMTNFWKEVENAL